MFEDLKIIDYPDPRLRKVSAPVTDFNAALRDLSTRMLELMREAKGVGLAAAQVGQNIRMFVMNPTGTPGDDRVYVNPVLTEAEGEDAAEEGCLSLPKINVDIYRSKSLRLQAQDLDGKPIDVVESGFVARVWQHEYDHLNGVLIIDRMGVADKFKYRKTLREMEEAWAEAHPVVKKTRNPKSEIRNKSKGSKSK